MMPRFDALIIGTGQAGPFLAERLAAAGQKVAVVERKLFGGTCVNTGCTPTKTMVASAYAAYVARRATDFGVLIRGAVSVDMRRVKARKDAVSEAHRSGVENWLKQMKNCTVFEGHARFESEREVCVGEETITADQIFINVGGRALVPAMPGLERVPFFTNSSMMAVDLLPKRLIIVGGSYVGLEFGQMFRRFGSEVVIVERGTRLLPREDEDISATIQEILEGEGIELQLGADCISFSGEAERISAQLDSSGAAREVTGTHVLLAVGRRPNTDDLGLEKAGVRVDGRGYIVVDDLLRTNVPGIWALGDCNGRGAFTHTAFNDFEIVAGNLLDHDQRRVTDRIPCYGLFIDPPLGRVGVTERDARETGRRVLVGKRPMTQVARAVEKGEPRGLMKVVVDAGTGEILGAAILGVGGDEAVHSLLDIMYAKAPYAVIQRAVHIHPTVSELIPTMLSELRPAANQAYASK